MFGLWQSDKSLKGTHFLFWRTRVKKVLVVAKRTEPSGNKYHCQWTLLRGKKLFFFSEFWQHTETTWVRTGLAWARGSHGMSSTTAFQANVSKLRRPLDTVDRQELPDSRERTGAPVLWLSCEGQIDVLEMFSDNSEFERHSWSTRTPGCSASWLQNKEGREFFATVVERLLVQARKEETQYRDVCNCCCKEP